MSDRFEIPDLPSVASPGDTHVALDTAFNAAQAGLNTIDDEAALTRFLLHGVGRVDDGANGATLSVVAGVLRLANGYFVAGAGVAEGDVNYFPGARLIHVDGDPGYIEIATSDNPQSSGDWFGHMDASGEIVWLEAPQNPRQNGRWLVAKVTTDSSGSPTAVDNSVADTLSRTNSPVDPMSGDPGYLEDSKYSRADPRGAVVAIEANLQAKLNELEARLTEQINSGGRVPAPSKSGFYAHRQAVLIHKIRTLDTLAAEDFEGAFVQAHIGGEGTADTENHLGPSTMTECDRGWRP